MRYLILIVALALPMQGCAVLEPIGSFFVQGYRNTVAYFNAFYNASRLFSEAEDDYLAGYRAYQEKARSGATTPFRVPQTAAQKFNAVIDKCSNILTFQAESDFVEDALFLVARSYDYLGEWVKAERKYSELLTQYPNSDHRREAVARLGGVLLKQERADEALVLLEQAEQEAESSGDEDLLPYVLEQLAVLHRDRGEFDTAHSYYSRLLDRSADDERIVSALTDYARLQLQLEHPDEALKIAQNIDELTDDPFYLYDARTLEVEALRAMGALEGALQRIDETLQDFRFLAQRALLNVLRADVLMETGREREALDAYTLVDTTNVRTAPGAAAAIALGKYYMAHGAYGEARAAFDRAAAVSASPVAPDARRNSLSVTRYLALEERYWKSDSALSSLRDSITVLPDPRIDSMETLLGTIMQDMGDWHYAEGSNADSAFYWLNRSIMIGNSRPPQARALFILADIVALDSVRALDPDDYYKRIVEKYPDSPYADESRRRLGIELVTEDDPGFGMYRRGESVFESGKPAEAVIVFDSLAQQYPKSAYAMRGVFAAGWIYDHYLAEAESAAVRYDRVVNSKETGSILKHARTRLAAIGLRKPDSSAMPTVPAMRDTTNGKQAPANLRLLEERGEENRSKSAGRENEQDHR